MLYNPLSINDLRGRGMPAPRNSLTLSELRGLLRGLVVFAPDLSAALGEYPLAHDRHTVHALIAHGDVAAHRKRHLGRARHTHTGHRPIFPVAPARRRVLLVLDFCHLVDVVLAHDFSR